MFAEPLELTRHIYCPHCSDLNLEQLFRSIFYLDLISRSIYHKGNDILGIFLDSALFRDQRLLDYVIDIHDCSTPSTFLTASWVKMMFWNFITSKMLSLSVFSTLTSLTFLAESSRFRF